MKTILNFFFSKSVIANIAFYSSVNGSSYDKKYVENAIKFYGYPNEKNDIIKNAILNLNKIDLTTFNKYYQE